jgi:hypothetical protein
MMGKRHENVKVMALLTRGKLNAGDDLKTIVRISAFNVAAGLAGGVGEHHSLNINTSRACDNSRTVPRRLYSIPEMIVKAMYIPVIFRTLLSLLVYIGSAKELVG